MDIPLALFAHEIAGLGLLGGAWAGCYYLQPTRRGMKTFTAKGTNMQQAMKSVHERFERLTSWGRHIPFFKNADRPRLLLSLAESSIARKVALPITVPLKIGFACYTVFLLKGGSKSSTAP